MAPSTTRGGPEMTLSPLFGCQDILAGLKLDLKGIHRWLLDGTVRFGDKEGRNRIPCS